MNAETVNMVGMMVAAPLHGSDTASASAAEMASKKIRKPYTITKCRESWTEQEHDKFFEALQLFDRDWKKIEAFVGSKTVIQIRSHAQKYFLKVQKNGTREHLPPPRPKRKSAQPYPQKAAKAETICSAPMAQQVSRVTATPASQSDPLQILRAQPCTVFVPTTSTSTVSAWVHHAAPPVNCAYMAKGIPAVDFGAINMIPDKEFDSGSGKSPGCWSQQVPSSSEGNQETCIRATPNFAEVYSFIGNVFDPSTCDHLKMLKEMAPIDRETVILLMRNLSINLSSPTFEEHKLFLSVYDMGLIDTKLGVGSGTEEQMGGPCGAPLSSPVC